MNKDVHMIFEAYVNSKKVVTEAPISADDLTYTGSFKTAPGKGYGLGKIASEEGKDIDEVAKRLLPKIKTIFKQEPHEVNGKQYTLYYPGSDDKFKSELIPLIQNELKINKTLAGYTARIVNNLLNVVRSVDPSKSQGVTTDKAVEVATIKGLKNEPVRKATSTETVYEIDKTVKMDDKNIKKLLLNLPDEDVGEREILGVLKDALKEYNETPGLDKNDIIKIKSYDLLDHLKSLGAIKEKQVEKSAAEGEGTGEIETIEDYPEGDDVTTVARELGFDLPRKFDSFDS